MNETAANASAYIACAKEYMNQRLITTVDQQNWVKMMANIVWWQTSTELFFYHIPVFRKKSHNVGSTWKRSEEEVTYNSVDVK